MVARFVAGRGDDDGAPGMCVSDCLSFSRAVFRAANAQIDDFSSVVGRVTDGASDGGRVGAGGTVEDLERHEPHSGAESGHPRSVMLRRDDAGNMSSVSIIIVRGAIGVGLEIEIVRRLRRIPFQCRPLFVAVIFGGVEVVVTAKE